MLWHFQLPSPGQLGVLVQQRAQGDCCWLLDEMDVAANVPM